MTPTILKATAAAVALACGATAWALAPAAVPLAPPTPPVVSVAAPVPADAGKAADGIADAMQRRRSANNIKQIMIAVHNYHDANGFMPRNIEDKNGKPLLSWRVNVLPYLDHGELYKKFKLDEAWDSDNNKKLLPLLPSMYRVGFEVKGETKTHYQGFAGPGTAFEPGQKLTLVGFTDGTSNTIGVIEAGPPVEWTKPADIAYDPKKDFPKLDGPFRNVVMAGLMDGSAIPLKPDLKADVFHNFVQRADGNVIDRDNAKADTPALSKEDKELAAKLQKENAELSKQVTELLLERQKLIAARVKKQLAGPDLEKLHEEQEILREQLDRLKQEIERLTKELEK